MNATCRHVEAPSATVLSYDMPVKIRPSSGNWFHCLHATSHALQPMQSVVSVKKPFRCDRFGVSSRAAFRFERPGLGRGKRGSPFRCGPPSPVRSCTRDPFRACCAPEEGRDRLRGRQLAERADRWLRAGAPRLFGPARSSTEIAFVSMIATLGSATNGNSSLGQSPRTRPLLDQ